MRYHILNSLLFSSLQFEFDWLEIKIQARCSCQLFLSTQDDSCMPWNEHELQSIGFTSIPGEIKTSICDMSKIYLKHLKPGKKLDLPQRKGGGNVAVFVK